MKIALESPPLLTDPVIHIVEQLRQGILLVCPQTVTQFVMA